MQKAFELGPFAVEPGTRKHLELPVMKQPDGKTIGIPLIIINGNNPGPRLYVSSGVHGDEVEGTAAIIDVANSIDPTQLSGTFIGATVVSVPSFIHKSSVDVSGIRENPIDWKNLARVYPGRAEGTLTERIADTISNVIFNNIDYAIDLHSGGSRGTSVHLSGFIGVEGELGDKSLELAKLFPIKILWRSSPWAKINEVAIKHNVPLVIIETTGQGRADEWDVKTCVTGITNIMKHLGMITGEISGVPQERRYIESETYIYARDGGFLRPVVTTGELIKENQKLGIVQDIYGNTVEEVFSPLEGIVTGIRTKPVAWAGEPIFLVANFIEGPSDVDRAKQENTGQILPP